MDEIGTDVESCIGIPEGVIEGLSRNRKEPSGVIMAGYLGQDRGGGIQWNLCWVTEGRIENGPALLSITSYACFLFVINNTEG